jgi:tetratricopeptide (TPR) repeat protein
MHDGWREWDGALVDGDRGGRRPAEISADVKMSNVVRRFLSSIQSMPAVGISILFSVALFVTSAAVSQQSAQHPDHKQAEDTTKRRFLSALAAYKAQRYAAAQRELELLVTSAPNTFEVNELLGLVYVAQDKQEQANQFLAKAVQLRPNVAEARTALATNFLALHRTDQAEVQFKRVVEMEPQSYDANHNLGEFYIQTDQIANAVPFLKRAQEIDPTAYNNGYDLALALEQTGRLDEAREQLQRLIALRDSAELHSLLGEVEEKSKDYVASAAQYEQAARMEPNEQNMLNWGAELLLHQTFVPAIEVFKAGTQRYPQSAQLHDGLGIAFYGAGQMDESVHAFLRASDLTPSDPLPLTFLGKACDGASPELAAQVRSRLQSFITHDHRSAELNYYLATCLWRGNQIESKADLTNHIESLLKRSLTLDPDYFDAHFQLGNLYAEQHKYPDAIEQYERALKINANSANIHYRLGQALARAGNADRAQEEFVTFERLRKNESDATNKEQTQIQQFVYTMRKSDENQQ